MTILASDVMVLRSIVENCKRIETRPGALKETAALALEIQRLATHLRYLEESLATGLPEIEEESFDDGLATSWGSTAQSKNPR